MKMTGNTILITGGGTGIGRALAETFHTKGNKVIVAGRRESVLKEVAAANPGIAPEVLDIADPASINQFVERIKSRYPSLNVVIHNSGVMKMESIGSDDVGTSEEIITINLLGPIRLNSALLPFLRKQPQAVIMTVSSGLAFVPISPFPTYCATKAAIHSYTQSLRRQLKDTNIQVIELVPPYVQTELTGSHQASDPRAMPLKDFIAETFNILETQPGVTEVCVDRVNMLRKAEASGNYDAAYKQLNEARFAPPPSRTWT
jgi:uncharacterized oxidoreductase